MRFVNCWVLTMCSDIEEQWKQDVNNYGDDAYLMWEFRGIGGDWQDFPCDVSHDDVIKAMTRGFYEHRRKVNNNV